MQQDAVNAGFNHYFAAFARQARTLTEGLSDEQFWGRPYPYGNSIGHLILHITGNLNYFVGARIAGTGYVRNRDLEFTDTSGRSREDVLRALDEAVSMVASAIARQSPSDWSLPYEAVGADDPTRFSIVLRCAAHFHHHLGQVIYLVREHVRRQQG